MVIKPHDAKQHAGIGENVGSFLAVDLQKFNEHLNGLLRLVHRSGSPFILRQHKHVNVLINMTKYAGDMACLETQVTTRYRFTYTISPTNSITTGHFNSNSNRQYIYQKTDGTLHN